MSTRNSILSHQSSDLFCSICRKLFTSRELVRMGDYTPAGTFTYIHRLNSVISLPAGGSDYLCQKCADCVHQLEALQLKIIEIENNLFNVYNSVKTEVFKEEIISEFLEPEVQLDVPPSSPIRKMEPIRARAKAPKLGRVLHICEECENPFKTKKLLAKHLLRVHSITTAVSCEQCTITFDSVVDLSAHDRKVHGGTITCETCGKSVMKSSMYAHEKFHALQGKGQFICDVCSRMFLTVGNLQTHMRTHTQEEPYACNKCDKSFKWNSSLNTHIQAAHNNTFALYKCEVCERGFKDKTNLRKHEFTHGKPKPFNCESCGKGFIRRDLYSRHADNCS